MPGGEVEVDKPRAASTCILGFVKPFLKSRIGFPVLVSKLKTSSTVAGGFCCFITAHNPVTCGVAIDVPEKNSKLSPGVDELIDSPGASKSKIPALLEKVDT